MPEKHFFTLFRMDHRTFQHVLARTKHDIQRDYLQSQRGDGFDSPETQVVFTIRWLAVSFGLFLFSLFPVSNYLCLFHFLSEKFLTVCSPFVFLTLSVCLSVFTMFPLFFGLSVPCPCLSVFFSLFCSLFVLVSVSLPDGSFCLCVSVSSPFLSFLLIQINTQELGTFHIVSLVHLFGNIRRQLSESN